MIGTIAGGFRAMAIGFAVVSMACTSMSMVHADTIYKSTGPDGEITYSTQPAPGARESTVVDIPSMSPEQRRAALLLRRQDKALSAEVNAQLRSLEGEWRRVDREIVSAHKELGDAERALQKGRTPLPGERQGHVGGGSRLTEAYFQRLRKVETRVEKAKQRLERAYAARNDLK